MNSQHSVLIIMLSIFAFPAVSLIPSSPPICTIKNGPTGVGIYTDSRLSNYVRTERSIISIKPEDQVVPIITPHEQGQHAGKTVDVIKVKVVKSTPVEGWVRKDLLTEPCYKNRATSKA